MRIDNYDYDSDQEVSKQHKKLLKNVAKLDKAPKWIKRAERTEPSFQVSERHLVKSAITDNDLVSELAVLKKLGGKSHHKEIINQSKSYAKNAKTLHKPAEKIIEEKLKRQVGYVSTKKQLGKWDPIIQRNRVATQLAFPLKSSSIKLQPKQDYAQTFTPLSELERQIYQIDAEEENKKEEPKTNKFDLTLAEVLQRRRETAKFRAQQSYKEAKAHRLKKIKSKKFHRIENKARIRRELKEFEVLQKTDPAAALEKLEQLDRVRAEERMSLRHKSTGKWAKNKQVRAKYDKESRQILAQQLSLSRELTQKVRKNEDSDEDVDEEPVQVSPSTEQNPWVNSVKTTPEIDNFISEYRKFSEKKNDETNNQQSATTNESDTQPIIKVIKNRRSSTLNPVVQVEIIEQVPNNSNNIKLTEKKKRKSHEQQRKNPEKIVKITKKISKSEDQQEKPVKIAKKLKIKSGTSVWSVESFENPSNNSTIDVKTLQIDDIFDRMETKVKQKLKKKIRKVKQKLNEEPAEASDEEEKDSDDDGVDLSFKKRKIRPEVDEALDEIAGDRKKSENDTSTNIINQEKSLLDSTKQSNLTNSAEIDPNTFISVKPKHIKTQMPDDVTGGDDILDDSDNDDENSQYNIITEAFADDDVVEEFRKDKESEIKKSQPDDIDMRLPGWGSWGGKNIKVSLRKKRRFILKFPKDAPRKDENSGNVIIMEDVSQMKQHQVSDLPYPFTDTGDFEASIRQPFGRTFVTENAHKRLTEPALVTKLGKIIEPMDEDVLLKKSDKINGNLGEADSEIRKNHKEHKKINSKLMKKNTKKRQINSKK